MWTPSGWPVTRGLGTGSMGIACAAVGGVGWEHVHVCVDDATRLAYVKILPAEDAVSPAAFLQRASG